MFNNHSWTIRNCQENNTKREELLRFSYLKWYNNGCMNQKVVELTDVEGKTLVEMAIASVPIAPRLVCGGTDSSGSEKNAEITLEDYFSLPTHELRVGYMAGIGRYAASLSPYITHLEEVHFLQKKTLNLEKLGYNKDESVIIISGINVLHAKKATRACIILGPNTEAIGFKLVDASHLNIGVAHSQLYKEIQAFIDLYVQPQTDTMKGTV
jgi:hypothetical protein